MFSFSPPEVRSLQTSSQLPFAALSRIIPFNLRPNKGKALLPTEKHPQVKRALADVLVLLLLLPFEAQIKRF